MTLHQLRALLERALHADGPTPPHIARLGSTVTVEDLARAYLPDVICVVPMLPADSALFWPNGTVARQWDGRALSMYECGTVNAVKVALALALGRDPGPMGCAVGWESDIRAYVLYSVGHMHIFTMENGPTIAAEPDPVRALILAVEHVLCSPA